MTNILHPTLNAIELQSILPPNCFSCVEVINNTNSDSEFTLYPEELALTKKMSSKRLYDFSSGRYAARKLLLNYEIEKHPILIGENRAPIWPTGIIGSISHSENLCIAVISDKKALNSIGVDIESSKRINADILPLICNEEEISHIKLLEKASNINILTNAKLIFSIKESLFKCLNPLINNWIDYKEMQVKIDLKQRTYLATPISANQNLIDIGEISGKWFSNDYFHISSCWL